MNIRALYVLVVSRIVGGIVNQLHPSGIFEKIYGALTLFVYSAVTLATLGTPYWHYRNYHFHNFEKSSEGDGLEQWPMLVESMGASWEIYSFLSAAVFPLMFPMLSISGLPVCSIACFVATMTLFTGVVCLTTSTLFKVIMIKALQKDRIREDWIQASPQSWYQVPDQGFWIFLSLPTIWFALSFGLLLTTIMLSVWERLNSVSGVDVQKLACSVETLSAFKHASLMMFFAGLLHFICIFLRYRSMSA